MAILVFQHWDVGNPGRLGSTLRDHGHRIEIIRPDLGEAVPGDLDGVRGLVLMGGPQSITSPEAWMHQEMSLIRQAHDAELPVIGVCLGAQMIAQALGGSCGKAPAVEFGFKPAVMEFGGQTGTMTAGVPWNTMQFHSHGDQVTDLPPGAQLLMAGEKGDDTATRVQMFTAGLRTIGFQFHLEVGPDDIVAYAQAEPKVLEAGGLTMDELAAQVEEHYDRFAVVSDRLCVNMVTHAFPFSALTSV